jgi:hypothetical protein
MTLEPHTPPAGPPLADVRRSADLAEKIADALMKNADGKVATRLELKRVLTERLGGPEESLGGWCRSAVIREICEVLRQNDLTLAPAS